jgi:hypothetical protein
MERKVIWPAVSPLYVDYRPDYRNTVFLAGTERSGTTWISDVINYRREYRYMFEPFRSARVDLCSGFKPHQYLRPDDQNPYFVKTVETILSGKIRNRWIDRYHRCFLASKRLVKDVRANLFLKWVYRHFPEMPIILLLRHPCAVARSHLRRTHLQPSLEHFSVQEELMEDHLGPYRKAMEAARTRFEKYIFRWCIENYVPLRQFEKGEIHLAFYECFCTEPENEVRRLFSFLDKKHDRAVFRQLGKPSPVSRAHSPIISGGSLVDDWRREITDDQIQRAVEILSLFGLHRIYSRSSMPNTAGAHDVLGEMPKC